MRAPSPVSDADRAGETPSLAVGVAAVSPSQVPPGESASPEEIELVAAVKRGEGWAAQEVWDRHAGSVRRFLARALGPRADVDDLTQETFMRVFLRMESLRDAGALREFVLAVAVNVLRRELRRRWVRRRVLLSHDGAVPEMEGPTADPEARQALARCYAILDKLGARERAAFVLRYMEERTLDEVAQVLDVSLSTAKRLVNKSTAYVDRHVGNDEGLRTFFERRRRSVANTNDSQKATSNVRG